MGYCKTQAITLRRRDYSNSSQIATFYTRTYGKIRALAKGSKRAGKKSPGSIDLLSYMEIVFVKKESMGLHPLTEWEPLRDFPTFRKDIERLYAACHVVGLVDELTEEGDKNEPLFDLILDTFCSLSQTKDADITLRAFELQMLKLLGYLPQLEECVNCGTGFGRDHRAAFSPVGNGLLCKRCVGGETHQSLSPGALRAAVFLASSSTTTRGRLHLPHEVSEELRVLSHGCITFALNRPVEMRKFGR
ncbi:MAG: DNA repair protein RecO [Candidatus Brocadiales bacterium]